MLRALAVAGVGADMVVGASVGAINGAYFAGAPTLEGVLRLEQLWRGLRREDIFPVTWRSILGFVRRRDFLLSQGGLRALIESHLPYRNLEEARVPIHVVATDLLSGLPVVLSQGPAADAIMASSAIPAAFAPVEVGTRFLVDGAVTSNSPVRVAVELGARRLVVLPTGYACGLSAPPRRAVASALHALTLLISRQMIAEIESLGRDVDYYVVPPLCRLGGSPYDFSQTGELIERAAQQTSLWIAEGGLTRRAIPDALRPHRH
jgi:NTE family protein